MKELDEEAKKAFIALCTAEKVDQASFNQEEFERLLSIEGFLEGDMGDGFTPLQYAIACAYPQDEDRFMPNPAVAIEVAKALIECGAKLTSNNTNKTDYSPIGLAIRSNQPDLIELMLSKDIDPNFLNREGKTLLHIAMNHAGLNPYTHIDYAEDIYRALLQHGVNPYTLNSRGESVVDILTEEGNEDDLAYVKPYMTTDNFLQAELQKAPDEWNMGKIKNRAEKNPDLNWSNINGDTYLHLLSERDAGIDSVAAVNHLINHGVNVDINQQNMGGETAALRAFKRKNVSVLKALIEKGADLSIKDAQGKSVINYAYEFEESDEFEAVINVLDEQKKFVRVKEVSSEVPVESEAEVEHAVVGAVSPKKRQEKIEFKSAIHEVLHALVQPDEQIIADLMMKIHNNPGGERAEFRKKLRKEMNWTAYKPQKVKIEDLKGVAVILSDIQVSKESQNNLDVSSMSEAMQQALFNIVAYAGKIQFETPNTKQGNDLKAEKLNATKEFLKDILEHPKQMQEKVQEVLNDPNAKMTKNRGAHSYWIHGLFAGKGHKIKSTMHELLHDLNKTLEKEATLDQERSSNAGL